jgi:parallel beta-helix repeat protein
MVNNNLILDNEHGIYMSESSQNNISYNNITGNHLYGIYALSQSNSNIFTRNRISMNNYGIRIKGAKDNRFFKNIVINNVFKGIYLCCGSMNNIQYKNNIINNTQNADDRYSNVWYFNNSGNYWDDYKQLYPDAVDQDNDGIWDTPYTIYKDKKDNFPAVKPYEFF